jgi:hypothetical protein
MAGATLLGPSQPIVHSSTAAEVQWLEKAGQQAGEAIVERLAKARTQVVLHFVMEEAKLFTFRFLHHD